jgi:hypothetical protein
LGGDQEKLLSFSFVRTYLPLLAVISVSCTRQLPSSFRFEQQEEAFNTNTEINTKVDILWVVDNTPSMWPSQKKIREGMRQFADIYMKPNWDIQVGVISQDAYLAHPAFAGFLNSVGATGSSQRYSRAAGFTSTYLSPTSGANPRRATPFQTPNWWVTTSIDATGKVVGGGVKLRHAIPEYGGANPAVDVSASNPSLYATLSPGRHDGPLTTLCWTSNSNPFFFGVSSCHIRDTESMYSGSEDCVAEGGVGNLDSSVQCVNTLMNNTVRSGKPIIATKPPQGTPADAQWTEQLKKDFLVNLSGGVSGYPLEMIFSSLDQFVTDNEAAASASKFFRKDALRVIIIVTDEDDQSTVFPAAAQITPDSLYDPNASCPFKTVDAHTYRLQLCPKPAQLRSVSAFKDGLDTFFKNLDEQPDAVPNYFVVTITPKTGAVLKQLHDEMGENANSYGSVSSDYGTRLFEFSNSVGNGSINLEITSPDYSDLLDQIGRVVVQKKSRFKLRFQPSREEDMLVWIVHADGSKDLIGYEDIEIDGFDLVITDMDIILGLSDTDRLLVDYQPGSLQGE